MECPYTIDLGAGEFFDGLRPAIAERRVPLAGSLELTWRCNLRCKHCYITGAESWSENLRSQNELTTGELCRLLDEIADAGCLYLLLTGGEPLVREDFWELYLHAKRRGMFITLFSNGTLVDGVLARKLGEFPPRYVEISLYGRTQATYEQVTGIAGSHERCMRGIELLLEQEVPVKLKTMVLTLNRHELDAMRDYAEGLGLDFRWDAMLHGCVDGSAAPHAYRLSPEEAVALDASDAKLWDGWRSYFERTQDAAWNRERLYQCGAGVHSFHIDAYGRLSICMMVRGETYDLRQGSFRDGWQGHAREVRLKPARGPYACQDCRFVAACGVCPGWSQIESGGDALPVEYLCQVTHLRAQAFGFSLPEGS